MRIDVLLIITIDPNSNNLLFVRYEMLGEKHEIFPFAGP